MKKHLSIHLTLLCLSVSAKAVRIGAFLLLSVFSLNLAYCDTLSITSDPYLSYAGEYTDLESHQQYLLAREYNPEISRFDQWDTVSHLNRYSYANGNPIMLNDPSGHTSVPDALNGLFTNFLHPDSYLSTAIVAMSFGGYAFFANTTRSVLTAMFLPLTAGMVFSSLLGLAYNKASNPNPTGGQNINDVENDLATSRNTNEANAGIGMATSLAQFAMMRTYLGVAGSIVSFSLNAYSLDKTVKAYKAINNDIKTGNFADAISKKNQSDKAAQIATIAGAVMLPVFAGENALLPESEGGVKISPIDEKDFATVPIKHTFNLPAKLAQATRIGQGEEVYGFQRIRNFYEDNINLRHLFDDGDGARVPAIDDDPRQPLLRSQGLGGL